jgi:hypothetical protein
MDSTVAPNVADLYMVYSKQLALNTTLLKTAPSFRYVSDIFAVWCHSWDELQAFLDHLNSIHPCQVHNENKRGQLTAISRCVHTKKMGQLAGAYNLQQTVHRELYLHVSYHHDPSQKCAFLFTLAQHAKVICNSGSLN